MGLNDWRLRDLDTLLSVAESEAERVPEQDGRQEGAGERRALKR
jgi:hypothetical protein